MQRIKVLFPEPDGPTTTSTSPVAIDRSMSARTWLFPNHFWTPENSIAAVGGIRVATSRRPGRRYLDAGGGLPG